MRTITAPNKYDKTKKSVFLAGSIEQGKARNWQEDVINKLVGDMQILNPRREHWGKMDADQFNEQVNWELDALEDSEIIIMYFAPGTKSPISLLELGLFARSGKMIVCCPDGFWRKGNVEVVCKKFNIPLYDNLEEVIQIASSRLR